MYDSLPLPTHLVTAQAEIRPWVDPTVDSRGADPRGSYAERYWLSVIGPTAAERSQRKVLDTRAASEIEHACCNYTVGVAGGGLCLPRRS